MPVGSAAHVHPAEELQDRADDQIGVGHGRKVPGTWQFCVLAGGDGARDLASAGGASPGLRRGLARADPRRAPGRACYDGPGWIYVLPSSVIALCSPARFRGPSTR